MGAERVAYPTVGYDYAWWHGDPLPILPPLPGFRAEATDDKELVAKLASLSLDEVKRRIHSGNRPYVAYLGEAPVAYGWVARNERVIGEVGLRFVLPAGNCELWDCATLPAWRGRGVYPRLLQSMLAEEPAKRFWIGHSADNVASARGIVKAGIRLVGDVVELPGGTLGLVPRGTMERAVAAAARLHLRIVPFETPPDA